MGKAERQRSRFGLASRAPAWHALAAEPGSGGSSAQVDQSQPPSRPGNASPQVNSLQQSSSQAGAWPLMMDILLRHAHRAKSPEAPISLHYKGSPSDCFHQEAPRCRPMTVQAGAPVPESFRQQAAPPLSSRALQKLKRVSLSRGASPRSGAESPGSRAEDLQRQLSAMQACGLAPAGGPQQHAADDSRDGAWAARNWQSSAADARRAARLCPDMVSVSQSSPDCALAWESQHGGCKGAEAAEPRLKQEAAHCSQKGAMPPARGSAPGGCSERSGEGDGMASPAAMSPASAAHWTLSPASAGAQAPAHVQPSAAPMSGGHCFWRRICPGTEVFACAAQALVMSLRSQMLLRSA